MMDFLKSFFAGEKTIAEKTLFAANTGRDILTVTPAATGVDVHDDQEEEEGDCGAPCGGCGCG